MHDSHARFAYNSPAASFLFGSLEFPMPRKPSIWLREQDGFYYTTFRGKQVKLSQGEGEAEKAFHTLHANAPDEDKTVGYRPTFRKLADLYLDYTQQTK